MRSWREKDTDLPLAYTQICDYVLRPSQQLSIPPPTPPPLQWTSGGRSWQASGDKVIIARLSSIQASNSLPTANLLNCPNIEYVYTHVHAQAHINMYWLTVFRSNYAENIILPPPHFLWSHVIAVCESLGDFWEMRGDVMIFRLRLGITKAIIYIYASL